MNDDHINARCYFVYSVISPPPPPPQKKKKPFKIDVTFRTLLEEHTL